MKIILILLVLSGMAFALTNVNNCTSLTTNGETYNITQNITGDGLINSCLNITGTNITLLGNGFRILGAGPTGQEIRVAGNNASISNVTVHGSTALYGIRSIANLTKISNVSLRDFIASDIGIFLEGNNNNISDITIIDAGQGIRLTGNTSNLTKITQFGEGSLTAYGIQVDGQNNILSNLTLSYGIVNAASNGTIINGNNTTILNFNIPSVVILGANTTTNITYSMQYPTNPVIYSTNGTVVFRNNASVVLLADSSNERNVSAYINFLTHGVTTVFNPQLENISSISMYYTQGDRNESLIDLLILGSDGYWCSGPSPFLSIDTTNDLVSLNTSRISTTTYGLFEVQTTIACPAGGGSPLPPPPPPPPSGDGGGNNVQTPSDIANTLVEASGGALQVSNFTCPDNFEKKFNFVGASTADKVACEYKGILNLYVNRVGNIVNFAMVIVVFGVFIGANIKKKNSPAFYAIAAMTVVTIVLGADLLAYSITGILLYLSGGRIG